MPIDWESDPRPFADCLQAWRAARGLSREQLAAELRTPKTTLLGWLAGRSCASEAAIRRLMTLIDTADA